MVSERKVMFWDVWRNVTSATTNWSFGGGGSTNASSSFNANSAIKKGLPSSSMSSKRAAEHHRYNRLQSCGPPKKSVSQPANLTSLAMTAASSTPSSSMESLAAGIDPLLTSSQSSTTAAQQSHGGADHNDNDDDLDLDSQMSRIAPKKHQNSSSNNHKRWSGAGTSMKHSISSFFPFTSCTTSTLTSPVRSTAEQDAAGKSALEPEDQRNASNNNSSSRGFLSNIYNATRAGLKGEGSSGDSGDRDHHKLKLKKPIATVVTTNGVTLYEEEDVSDLDDDVEHLTCDVCDRAFPTLKQLAAHQRKKRHYGCLQCDSIFPSREVLEYHREQMCHYDYAIDVYEEGAEEEDDFFESEDDEHGLKDEEDCDDEERERLL